MYWKGTIPQSFCYAKIQPPFTRGPFLCHCEPVTDVTGAPQGGLSCRFATIHLLAIRNTHWRTDSHGRPAPLRMTHQFSGIVLTIMHNPNLHSKADMVYCSRNMEVCI